MAFSSKKPANKVTYFKIKPTVDNSSHLHVIATGVLDVIYGDNKEQEDNIGAKEFINEQVDSGNLIISKESLFFREDNIPIYIDRAALAFMFKDAESAVLFKLLLS